MKGLRLWLQMFRLSIVHMDHYRMDMVARFLGVLPMLAMRVIVLSLPFQFVKSLAGWSQYEVLVVMGMFYISEGLSWFLFKRSISLIEEKMQRGMMDSVLLRPISSQVFLSFFDIDIPRLADVVAGVILVVVSMSRLGISLSLMNVVMAAIALLLGIIIVYAIYLMANTLAFWTTEIYLGHVVNPVFTLTRYPVDFWGDRIKQVFIWGLPLAFVSTIPGGLLVGKYSGEWVLAGVGVAGVWLVIATLFWRQGVRHYTEIGG